MARERRRAQQFYKEENWEGKKTARKWKRKTPSKPCKKISEILGDTCYNGQTEFGKPDKDGRKESGILVSATDE